MSRYVGVWAIAILYVGQGFLYFYGLDGADDYYWVNNDFFLFEMVVVSALITAAMVTRAVWERRRTPPEERTWNTFVPTLWAAALTLGIGPYAVFLALIAYVTGGSAF